MLSAMQNALVLKLDALTASRRAEWGVTLTTTPSMGGDLRALLRASQTLWQGVRRSYGSVEYCGMVEWTQGKGRTAMRLPHVHYLVKFSGDPIPQDELSERWRRATGSAWVVESRPLRTWAGAVAYLALHHHKREQAPPKSVRNTKRFRPSRGFFDVPLPALREQARQYVEDYHVAGLVLDALDAPTLLDEATYEALLDEHLERLRGEYRERKPALVKVDERSVAELKFADLRESKRRARSAK